MSRPKIYHNLSSSEYYTTRGNMKFYFSSESHKKKFDERIEEYLLNETSRFSWKLRGNVMDSHETLSLILYKIIETRGFLVYIGSIKLDENYDIQLTLCYGD